MDKEELEKLEIEYSLFEAASISEILEVKEVIEVFLDDCLDYLDSFQRTIKMNNRRKFIGKISNYFADIIGYDLIDGYDEDNLIIGDQVNMCNVFKDIVRKLSMVLNSNNYNEVYKLFEFVKYKFHQLNNYHEKRRDMIDLSLSGVGCYIPSVVDINSFVCFCDSEINRISLSNNVEKKKVL